jgi:hypothetical protein
MPGEVGAWRWHLRPDTKLAKDSKNTKGRFRARPIPKTIGRPFGAPCALFSSFASFVSFALNL